MEGHGDISVSAATTCVAVSHAATKILIIHLCRSLCSRIPLPKLRLQRLLATGSYVSWPSVHPLRAWSVKYASPSTRPCQWESSCRTVNTKNQTIQLLCLASILFCALVLFIKIIFGGEAYFCSCSAYSLKMYSIMSYCEFSLKLDE